LDPLQWMGAVRMSVQTADKNITIIHNFTSLKSLHKTLINGLELSWIICGLLWCFYQLFGLSFWRHLFSFCTDEEINSSTSKMQICTQMFTFGWNIPLTAFCFQFCLVCFRWASWSVPALLYPGPPTCSSVSGPCFTLMAKTAWRPLLACYPASLQNAQRCTTP